MNRRDSVLIAVLINMGLLVVLFVTALKPKTISETLSQKAYVQSEPVKQENQRDTSIDQVDQILSKYVMNEPKVEESSLTSAKQREHEPSQPEPPQKEEMKLREVIVKQGDMLEKIARQNGCSVDEIMRINKLADYSLQIGQIIYLPANTKSSLVEKKSTKEIKYYTVKNGDNPWTIAVKNKLKVEELLKLNGLDEAKAKKLKPGDQLRIQ